MVNVNPADEIEVTPEMIAAGKIILGEEPFWWRREEDMVSVIYRIMEAERRNPGSGDEAVRLELLKS